MFCTSCGARIQENANFCVACGGRVSRQTPPPPQTQPPDPPPAAPTVQARNIKYEWCGAGAGASFGSCPKCGATLNVREAVTRSGWAQLPGRKDMAKLQFGNSFCQIEGLYVPTADMNLSAGDSVYFTHHVLLW